MFSVSLPVEASAAILGEFARREARLIDIFGTRELGWANTTDFGDCCQYLDGTQSYANRPTSDQTLYLVSTSAQDAPAGTGARKVRIVYLDANLNEKTQDVALNGTTPVSLGTGYSAIQWMETHTVGSSGICAGAVSVSSTNGAATVATTFEQIKALSGRSLSARYVVPAGTTAYMMNMSFSSIGATMDVRLRSNVFADDRTLGTSLHFQERIFLPANAMADLPGNWKRYPPGALIKASAIPGSANAGNKLDSSFSLLLLK